MADITNVLFPVLTFTEEVTFFMDKLYIQPVIRIISAPVVSFQFVIGCGLFAVFATIRFLQFSSLEGITNNPARFFLEFVSGSVSCLFHGLAKFFLWAFTVFFLIFSSVGSIFRRCITGFYSPLSVLGRSIFSYGLVVLSSCIRIFQSLSRVVISTNSTISSMAIRAIFVFREQIYGLWFSTVFTVWVNTNFSFHDNNYITKKERAI